MPGGDRTGPTGMGPMTGRGAGFCAGMNRPGYANPSVFGGRGLGFGRGRGFGMGMGRGARWGANYAPVAQPAPYAPIPPQDELNALKSQAEYFGSMLEDIQNRITEMESKES